jgi:antitoxin component of MazEF toxin-antitoxin module
LQPDASPKVSIPKEIVRLPKLKVVDSVELTMSNGDIIIRKVKK